MMFDMTTPNQKQLNKTPNSKAPLSNQNTYVTETGQLKDAWYKEEELMRKKLEKIAVNQLKSRIAQQNRAAGNNKQQQDLINNDNDSDLDPNEGKDSETVVGNANGPSNANAV